MHGLTGGDWKRAANCETAPVPDPPTWRCELGEVQVLTDGAYSVI